MFNLNFTKMKKSLFFAVATAMVLSSCSQNEIMQDASDANAIDFGIYTNQTTKGAEVNTSSLEGTGFKVEARKSDDGAGYFGATNFTWSVDHYKTDAAKYWPTFDIDFLAYNDVLSAAPTGFSSAAGAFAECSYNIPTAAENQADIVFATLDDQNATGGTQKTLTFKHALSRISVQAKCGATGTGSTVKVKVTDITFKSLETGDATLTMNPTAISWTQNGTDADVTTKLSSAAAAGFDNSDYVNLLADNSDLMIIPQAIAATNTCDITYSIEDHGMVIKASATEQVDISALSTLVAGKQYTLRFTINGGIQPITFTASVDAWGNGFSGTEGDITIN